MSRLVKRSPKTVNPAGGINPAVQPNVGQYGWTSFDAANVNQLIDYVKAAREAAESAKNDAAFVKKQLENIDDTVLYFERLYNEIKPIAANIEVIYLEVVKMRDAINIQVEDVHRMHDAILVMFAEVQSILNEMRDLRDETKVYKDSAKASETASVEAMEKSLEIYEELRKGQVYRGSWNPNTGAYPDPKNTNSVWDVVLNAGQEDTGFVYDQKTWYFGDRVIYIKDETKYEQLASGTSVKSVNGKTGAVVLKAVDVDALPITGGTLKGGMIAEGSLQASGSIRSVDTDNTNVRIIPSNGYGYIQAGHSSNDADQKMLLSGMNGKGLTEFQIRMATGGIPQIRIGSSNYNMYHTGNKPTASDVGGVARSGDSMSGALTVPATRGVRTASQSDSTYAAMSAEGGYAMLWKMNNSTTVADEFIGIKSGELKFRKDKGNGDKTYTDFTVYHTGFKPTAADIGAMGSAGGTITGDMVLNEKLTVKKDMIVDMGDGLRKVTKRLGVIDNNKAGLVMLCPSNVSAARAAQGFDGRISVYRGAIDQYNLVSWVDLTARVSFTELGATLHDQYNNRTTDVTMKLVNVTYKGESWVALFIPSSSSRIVTIDGVVTNVEPEFIKDATTYSVIDFITTTEVVRSTRPTRSLDVTDVSSRGGYRYNNKAAIGGVNDSWLRLNPNSDFSSGIYSSTGVIRHDGGDIQLKNWATGTAKPIRITIPGSDQYVSANPVQAIVNVKVPASNNATRLVNVYDDAGKMKASIVSRDDTSGAISVITNGGTDNKHRVTISSGQIFAYGDQHSGDDALTKVSYTEGRYLKKTSDTMSGTLIAKEVEATLKHRNGYMVIKPYGSSYDDGAIIRTYYRGHDNNVPGTGWAGLQWDKYTPADASTGAAAKSESFDMKVGGNFVYHQGRKPTATELKVIATEAINIVAPYDFNIATNSGMFSCHLGSSKWTNAPVGFSYGTLLVEGAGALAGRFVTQTLTEKTSRMQWVRVRNDGAMDWSEWSAVFSEANPPKLESIDAVLRTGDTMTGHLYMDNNADIYMRGTGTNNPILWFNDKDNANKSTAAVYHDRTGDSIALNHYDKTAGSNKYAGFRMKYGTKAPTYAPGTGGTFHMYHEGYKPSAADVGAPVLSSATKAVELQSTDSAINGGAIRTERDDASQVTWMTDKPLSESYKAIGIHSTRGPVYNDGQTREIYHTGRKPTAADIDGVMTRGAWGIGDSQTFSDSAEGQDYTEDKSRDFNKLITTGTYSLGGDWVNSINNTGVAQTVTATIQVIARKTSAGPAVYQKFIMGKSGDGSRYAERTGTGTYPNITWSRWRELGTYQQNLEYRMTLERPGESAYPYITLHKRDDRNDLKTGHYVTGSLQFKHSTMSDTNNPDSGKLVALLNSDTAWDRTSNRVYLQVRKAADGATGTTLVLSEEQASLSRELIVTGEVKSKGSNSFRLADGNIGTFWRKDNDNLYLMRTEVGQAESGTFTTHRPFTVKLSDGEVTVGNGLVVGGDLKMASKLVMSSNYLVGANEGVVLRDHGNGNVTLSAGKNASGVAGDLYLGYNSPASGTGGYNTRQVQLRSPLYWGGGTTPLANDSGLNSEMMFGPIRTEKDTSGVYHTVVGGTDTVNRGRTIVAAGESGKAIADNTSVSAEDLYLSADNSIYLETAVQSGFAGRKTIKMTAGEIYAQDGTKRVYHQGFNPTASAIGAAPDGFGLGGNGGRCPDEDCNKAVANGFYAIYSGTTNTPETTGPSGSKMLVVAWSSQHVTQTFYRVTSNRTWTRSSKLNGSVVEWTQWAELYSTVTKPTAADVGALSLTGGTVNGQLILANGDYRHRFVQSGTVTFFQGGHVSDELDHTIAISGYNGKSLKTFRTYMQDNVSPLIRWGSTDHKVYHAGNKPTAADVSALSLTGGTLTGDLKITGSKKIILPTATYATGAQIYAQDADQFGANLIISSGGATVLGSGESGQAAANALADKSLPAGEKMYVTSDDSITFLSGANAWADRKESTIDKTGVMTLSNNLVVDKGGKKFTVGSGTSDTWLLNSQSGKYFQMKDDGSLQYDSKHIHYKGNPHTTGSMISESQALGVVDLNDYKTPGVYHQASNANATSGFNYPVKFAGSLVVYTAAGIIQEYRVYNTARLFRRAQYADGAWLAWQEDYNTSNVPSAGVVGALPITGGRIQGAFEVAPALGTNCINLLQTPNTGTNAIGVHGFTSNGSAIQWGAGMYYSGGQPQYAYYGSGAEPWVNGLKVSQGEVTTNGTFIAGGYSLSNSGFRVNKSEYPSMELHRVGTYAYLSTIDSVGNYIVGTSNGAGSLTSTCMKMSYAAVEFSGKVVSNVTGRGWTDSGQSGVYVQGSTNMSNGALQSAISMYSHYPNQYVSEAMYGVLHGGDWNSTVQVLSNYNGTNGARSTWMFANSGTLTAPGSNWRIQGTGDLVGNAYGGSSVREWATRSFAPASDAKLKTLLGESKVSALGQVAKMKFHEYVWNDESFANETVKVNSLGVVAQELEEIDANYTRDIVSYNEDGEKESLKALDTANLLAVALKAIQELQAEVETLKTQLNKRRK